MKFCAERNVNRNRNRKIEEKCNSDKPNREKTKEEGDDGVIPIEQQIYVALK